MPERHIESRPTDVLDRLLMITVYSILIIALSSSQTIASTALFPYNFTNQEAGLLESKSCMERYGLKVEKIIASSNAKTNPDEVYAEVLCESHDEYKFNPIHRVVFCERHHASWDCTRSELAIRVNEANRALIYFEDDVAAETAYNITLKLATSKYFQGEDIPKPGQAVCNIRQHFNDDGQLVPDVYVATCGTREVFISTWCPQQECPRIISNRKMALTRIELDQFDRHSALYSIPNFKILPSNIS
jgi:hypothetical protein